MAKPGLATQASPNEIANFYEQLLFRCPGAVAELWKASENSYCKLEGYNQCWKRGLGVP